MKTAVKEKFQIEEKLFAVDMSTNKPVGQPFKREIVFSVDCEEKDLSLNIYMAMNARLGEEIPKGGARHMKMVNQKVCEKECESDEAYIVTVVNPAFGTHSFIVAYKARRI